MYSGRGEERRQGWVRQPRNNDSTVYYAACTMDVWMCWMDTIQYAYGPDMLMYDGWLIISLSAWGKMTGCQSSALLWLYLLFPFGHQQPNSTQPNLSTCFTHTLTFFSFLLCRVTFQVTKSGDVVDNQII